MICGRAIVIGRWRVSGVVVCDRWRLSGKNMTVGNKGWEVGTCTDGLRGAASHVPASFPIYAFSVSLDRWLYVIIFFLSLAVITKTIQKINTKHNNHQEN